MTRALLILMVVAITSGAATACDDEPDGDADADADADGESDADADAGSDADADAGSDADGESDADAEGESDADAEPPDPRWDAFLAARAGYLELLSPTIESCVVREDTSNGAFHGCYDWHSAVHGVWALHALTRLLDDPRYVAIAEGELTAEGLAREMAALGSGSFPEDGTFELPYGFAWFLTLAAERARAGPDDLAEMAETMAAQLSEYIRGTAQLQPRFLCADYHRNICWAVVNLWQHAERTGDATAMEGLRAYVREHLVADPALCPLEGADAERSEFFPPALLRATAIVTVLPEGERDAWLAANVPEAFDLEPITRAEIEAVGAHLAGLNFARSWGLYALFRATGDRLFRDLYLDHLEASLAMPDLWDETSPYVNSHWIAQFGVYGIALSYDG